MPPLTTRIQTFGIAPVISTHSSLDISFFTMSQLLSARCVFYPKAVVLSCRHKNHYVPSCVLLVPAPVRALDSRRLRGYAPASTPGGRALSRRRRCSSGRRRRRALLAAWKTSSFRAVSVPVYFLSPVRMRRRSRRTASSVLVVRRLSAGRSMMPARSASVTLLTSQNSSETFECRYSVPLRLKGIPHQGAVHAIVDGGPSAGHEAAPWCRAHVTFESRYS